MKRINGKLFAIVIAALLACTAYFAWDYFGNKEEKISYVDFWQCVEAGDVSSVRFEGDIIHFTSKASPVKFKTQNPNSPVLQEELMKRAIDVTVAKDSSEIISLIFDAIFYLFFFGVIIIAFRKFISPNTFKVVHKTGVKFDDVVGMDKLKRDMVQVMEIMKKPAEYAKKGIRMPKGILLEGDPGNGKTLFAKALAGEAKINFISAKATDFESMFMAIGPLKVKLLFKKARRRAPCIVFIDEFDGI